MGGRIGTIFVLIIVAGIALYVYNSGALQKGYEGFQSLAPHAATGTATGGTETVPPAAGGGGAVGGAGEVIAPPPETPITAVNPADIPPGFTVNQLSPYFHQVRFGGASPSYGYSGVGQISLYTSFSDPSTTIDVTGWRVKATQGSEFVPQAINLYDPSGLAVAGDIRMKSGDYVNMYSSSAPFNLRLNKCIGYIALQNQQFNPALPQDCPYIDQSQVQNLSGACQNFVYSVGGCSQPNVSDPAYPHNDPACDRFVQSHFTYYSCFDQHSGDPDFLSNEIRVWTGYDPLNPYHDKVQLLDANGLLVDYLSY